MHRKGAVGGRVRRRGKLGVAVFGTKNRGAFVALLATSCLMSAHAVAQDRVTVLERIQVQGVADDGYLAKDSSSATKGDVPLEKTPQAISVIGSEQIRDQGASTVVEATRYSPGIRSETFGNDTRNDWFLIRGFSSQVSSYFLDGLQLQSSDSFATWKVNPYLLDRIDILRGRPRHSTEPRILAA